MMFILWMTIEGTTDTVLCAKLSMHKRAVGHLWLFCRYFHCLYLKELVSIILLLASLFGQKELKQVSLSVLICTVLIILSFIFRPLFHLLSISGPFNPLWTNFHTSPSRNTILAFRLRPSWCCFTQEKKKFGHQYLKKSWLLERLKKSWVVWKKFMRFPLIPINCHLSNSPGTYLLKNFGKI